MVLAFRRTNSVIMHDINLSNDMSGIILQHMHNPKNYISAFLHSRQPPPKNKKQTFAGLKSNPELQTTNIATSTRASPSPSDGAKLRKRVRITFEDAILHLSAYALTFVLKLLKRVQYVEDPEVIKEAF